MMVTPSIAGMTRSDFAGLPLVVSGESKEVRYFGDGLVAIEFKPTIHSFTEDRTAVVPGSEVPRLRASRLFVEELKRVGISHAYREVTDRYVLADLVLPHPVECQKYGVAPFVPPDLATEQIALLPKGPPIEVIAKRYLTGNTKKSCIGMSGAEVRRSHPFYPGFPLMGDGALPEMMIRFDWRNPLRVAGRGAHQLDVMLKGLDDCVLDPRLRQRMLEYFDRVADEQLPVQAADWFLDVTQARRTAALAAMAIENYLAARELVFYDMCLFVDEAGQMLYGELSPDCGRFRSLDGISFDKDVWRSGGSSEEVIRKWHHLCDLLEGGAR